MLHLTKGAAGPSEREKLNAITVTSVKNEIVTPQYAQVAIVRARDDVNAALKP